MCVEAVEGGGTLIVDASLLTWKAAKNHQVGIYLIGQHNMI